jgi:hypothetical protein
MIEKSLYDISWQVSEPEYRADPALSYSTLARYEREGFNNLDKLFDKIESPSLVFGSAVDTLITGSEEDFNNQFMVAELTTPPSDTLVIIVKRLFETFKEKYNSLVSIPDEDLLNVIEDIQWNNHWLPKTRAKKIKEDCAGYYGLLYLAGDRTIISSTTYSDIINTVDRLKSADSTRFFFEPDNAFGSTERLYQLKFKATFNDVEYRCMVDELIVDHERKLIIPVDLKTSSKYEWDFHKSFLDWHYFTQARLYWRIIKANLDKDPYFKDFTLVDYKFIVINRRTLTPLVWNFASTQATGELHLGKDGQIIIRDPFTIGEELSKYLLDKPTVPNGINLVKPNNLEEWINKL